MYIIVISVNDVVKGGGDGIQNDVTKLENYNIFAL